MSFGIFGVLVVALCILGFWNVFLSPQRRVAKPQRKKLFYTSKFLISIMYIVVLYPLIFTGILPLLSSDYALGCSAGGEIGYCFSAGILSAFIIFAIIPLISIVGVPLYYFSSSKSNSLKKSQNFSTKG
jgi:hypothetical protein